MSFKWLQIGDNLNSNVQNDMSEWSVSLSSDGETVAIGAISEQSNQGQVNVYNWDWNESTWKRFGTVLDGNSVGGQFGYSVSLSSDGETVAIGAPFALSNQGQVYIYKWDDDGSNWTQPGTVLNGVDAGGRFGYSVSLSSDGNTVAIGAPFALSNQGQAYIYNWNVSDWTQPGTVLVNSVSGQFGYSVSLSSDGNTVAIGAPGANNSLSNQGQVNIYNWNETAWVQHVTVLNGVKAGDQLGSSVSLSSDGNIVAIGAIGAGNLVRVYSYYNNTWNKLGEDIDENNADVRFGQSMSLSSDGKTVAIGAPNNGAGHFWYCKWNGSSWDQPGTYTDTDTGVYSACLVSLSSDGNMVAVAAYPKSGYQAKVRVFSDPPNIKSSSNNGQGPFGPGGVVDISITFFEIVVVDNNDKPYLNLSNDTRANYIDGSGTDTLQFRYTVERHNTSTNNLSITGIGGTILDRAGNNYNSSYTKDLGIKIDIICNNTSATTNVFFQFMNGQNFKVNKPFSLRCITK